MIDTTATPLSFLPSSNASTVAFALVLGLVAATSWVGALPKVEPTSSTSAPRKTSVHRGFKSAYILAALCLACVPVVEGKQEVSDGIRKAVFERILMLDHEGKCKEKAMVQKVQSGVTKCALPAIACQCIVSFFSVPAAGTICAATLATSKVFMDDMKAYIESRCKARADAKGNLARLSGKIKKGLTDHQTKKNVVGVIKDYANIKKRANAKEIRASVNRAGFDKAVGPPKKIARRNSGRRLKQVEA